ncbi:MAG: hypothetical protein A2V59_05345 [Armatimonadetes bacterium RBG_19FT_COMBO_69_19]|nr:MAG: hypothetical protein A2V59_05345 [Armatimonadetes bacterium RBG_19FT_COMBO_69_19]
MRPADAYDYLVETRGQLFNRVSRLSQRQYTREFPFARHSIRATLVHVLDSESWYARILAGEPEAGRSPFAAIRTSPFPALREAWEHQARRTREVLARPGDPDRRIEHVSVEGRMYSHRLRTTAAGVVTQLLFHEVHHRAQVMMMLRALGVPLQSIDYNLLRWTWFKKKKG